MSSGLLLLGLLCRALAQEPQPDPDLVPSSGIASEDGPGTLWVNPANIAYDADPRWGLFVRSDIGTDIPVAVGVTAGIGGFGAGIRWMRQATGETNVTVDLAASVRLPRRINIGTALRWNIERLQPNYAAFDVAAAWRPLPWFGIAVVTRNIGNPGVPGSAPAQSGGGVAFRPVGRTLVFGADVMYSPEALQRPPWIAGINMRLRPTRGFYIRARLDSTLRVGAGLEWYFGPVGVGTHVASNRLQDLDVIAWAGSDERREHLVPPRRRVDEIRLTTAPPYAPEPKLFRRADPSWLDILENLDEVERDPSLAGLLLTLGDIELSWAQWEELRGKVELLRRKDKEVLAYLVGTPSHGAVFTASAATKILVHPASVVNLTGLSIELIHMHGLLDAVGVDIQVARRSDYKTAAETWTRLNPSDAQREQQEALLSDLETHIVQKLAAGRGRSAEDVRQWIDAAPHSASQAERLGIVDGRAYPDQLDSRLEELHGKSMRRIQLAKKQPNRSAWDAPAEIATIYIQGPIVPGESVHSPLGGIRTGSDTVIRQLEQAAKREQVRAVMIRIDSPGGAYYAADEIWRAIKRLQAKGKPVVASLGGIATSGGYYIASAADAIWAEPTTVTGSIGVIAMKPSFPRLATWLGISATQLRRGRNAGMESMWTPWDPVQQAKMQKLVDENYDNFKERVAVGRGMTADAVENAARGRVWSGGRALELSLIDHLGGMDKALHDAGRLAGIRPRQPIAYRNLSERRGALEVLLPQLLGPAPSAEVTLAGSLLEATNTRTWTMMMALTLQEDSGLWMIDPWWMTIGPR